MAGTPPAQGSLRLARCPGSYKAGPAPILLRTGLAPLLVALALTGCSSGGDGEAEPDPAETGPRIVQPGAPGETVRELTPEELEDGESLTHTQADVEFMQNMILHHRQALELTALVPDRTQRRDLPLLAERIDISQKDEMDRMVDWLEARDETAPPEEAEVDYSGHLPGMLTPAELDELEAASGKRFDRLFLRSMIRHHEGALEMVAQLQNEGGGIEPEIGTFANHVVADQSIEINRMYGLLAELNS
jgi:uncharacterized protein (DUF305 family)